MARGDRHVGKVIKRAWELGCKFDAWSEHYHHEKWLQAFKESGLEPGFYANRERALNEILAWSHIDTGVSEEFLRREYEKSIAGEVTPDCRNNACNACGLEQTEVCEIK